ncbi:hypothetical protein [Pseudonocardia sp. ICBG1034]|uniref:hypothetical protein n=1 Tax=Pseudonocardia sp. ICBG1034 TaxID=2844381 RepID=UPI001CCFE3BF|nr:hypothetical protein [Pseudonocardia sp. ICBG1034]
MARTTRSTLLAPAVTAACLTGVADALDHDGPADAGRIDRAVCPADVMPAVDRTQLPANEARLLGQVATSIATEPRVAAEPPLREYARG